MLTLKSSTRAARSQGVGLVCCALGALLAPGAVAARPDAAAPTRPPLMAQVTNGTAAATASSAAAKAPPPAVAPAASNAASQPAPSAATQAAAQAASAAASQAAGQPAAASQAVPKAAFKANGSHAGEDSLLLGLPQPKIPWRRKKMTLRVESKEIGEVLRQIAASNGVAIQVDERIKGPVSGDFSDGPQQVLDLLSRTYGFFWFYDGNAVVVTPQGDVKSEVVVMPPSAMSNLQGTLRRLGVYDPRYPMRVDAPNRLVVLSGPSRYVDMMSGILRALQDSAQSRSPTEVLVYPLQYAWAEDRTVNTGNTTQVIPGIVTVLKGIYGKTDERDLSGGSPAARTRTRRPMTSLEGQRNTAGSALPAGGSSASASVNQILQAAGIAGAGQTMNAAQSLPVIVADARRNAVMIRDLSERLSRHKELLQELDTRSAMVEVEAQIVDVRTEAVESLGLDWRVAGARFDVESNPDGTGARLVPSASLATSPIDAANAIGGRATIFGGNAARFLISRIRALESDGKARTVATPRVTTLDNVQSVMSSREVFYVKVSGAYASDLFEVSAGVTLSVQPFVIRDGDGVSVRMAVSITDGTVDAENRVDGMPLTRISEINAEAVVREGSSLLIAGYAREEESSGQSGVPGLSKMPLVGGLFRSNSRNSARQERFFLLTPRVVAQ